MKILIWLLMSFFCLPATAKSWLHLYGGSWHDQPGYREINTGIGIERQFGDQWSWAVGTFHNSIDRQSVFAVIKYQWYQQGDFVSNLQIGGVTGYRGYSVAPVILPEACWKWACGMFIPRIENETTTAVAVYLRIPL